MSMNTSGWYKDGGRDGNGQLYQDILGVLAVSEGQQNSAFLYIAT